jgi:hypothetical protein
MDLERTMAFLLEQQAASQARFDADMIEIRATLKTMSGSEARHDREITEIRNQLRRAVRLSVQEARAERKRRKEGDEKLAASHAALEASLKAYFDSLKRGQNGHDKL